MRRLSRSLLVALAGGVAPVLACNAILGNEAGVFDPNFGSDAADEQSVSSDAADDQRVADSAAAADADADAGDEHVGKFVYYNWLGRCLGAIENDAGGSPIVAMVGCADDPSQRWNVERLEFAKFPGDFTNNVYYLFKNEKYPGYCLESGTVDGGASLDPCANYTGQLWYFEREVDVKTPVVYLLHTLYTGFDACFTAPNQPETRPLMLKCVVNNGHVWEPRQP